MHEAQADGPILDFLFCTTETKFIFIQSLHFPFALQVFRLITCIFISTTNSREALLNLSSFTQTVHGGNAVLLFCLTQKGDHCGFAKGGHMGAKLMY